MRSLSGVQVKQKSELAKLLTDSESSVARAISVFNEAIETQWEDVQAALDAYNQAVEQTNEFIQEVHEAQEEYIGNRTDIWYQSPNGEAYVDWASEWEMEIETLDVEIPEPVDEPEFEGAELLAQLPVSST